MTRAKTSSLMFVLSVLLVTGPAASHAQQAKTAIARAYGHWDGVVNSQLGSASLQIDIGVDDAGKPIAALTMPDQGVTGLPLRGVRDEGGSIAFSMPIIGEGSFLATLSEDGQSLAGTLDKGFSIADFQMTRDGEPRFPAEPANRPVAAKFAGEWIGALNVGGSTLPVRLSLLNRDAVAIGRLIVDDDLSFPLAIDQSDASLHLKIISAGEALRLSLAPNNDALVGEYLGAGGAKSAISLKRRDF